MTWFRRAVMAEMAKELETQPYSRLLGEINRYGGKNFPVGNWAELLKQWWSCSPAEKAPLLQHIFAVYREVPGPEWWQVWFLMFQNELRGLFQFFRRRIPDPDERWSIVVWSFMDEFSGYINGFNGGAAMNEICARMKRAINKVVHRDECARRTKKSFPLYDFLADSRSDDEAQENERFSRLCRKVSLFLGTLPAVDRMIIEEIYFLGHSRTACAERLGLSRHQVGRKLARMKTDMADRIQISPSPNGNDR
jgi:hypothetical protein